MSLVVAVLAMVLLSTSTIALLMVSATEPIIANNLLRGSQAFYVAESGLEIALTRLRQAAPPLGLVTGAVGAGTYALTFTVEDPDHVTVRAVGQVESAVRAVSNRFERDNEGQWRPMKQFKELE